jgi:hypothetical protein
MDLTEDEKKLVLERRLKRQREKKLEKSKKLQEELDEKSPSELTREQLIQRVERLELENFVRVAKSRMKKNMCGDWCWDERDEPYIRGAHEKLGLEYRYDYF